LTTDIYCVLLIIKPLTSDVTLVTYSYLLYVVCLMLVETHGKENP